MARLVRSMSVMFCAFLCSALPAIAATTGNLVANGGAEVGPTGDSDAAIVVPQGWTTSGNFTAVKYGSSGLPDTAAGSAVRGGVSLFAGGPNNSSSSATQTVKVPVSWVASIGAGTTKATLSAALGGWESQGDAATVSCVFLDASGASIGSVRIGPVTPAQRGSATKLLATRKTAAVPSGTRSMRVTVSAIRGSGAYNDGYADTIVLRLSR